MVTMTHDESGYVLLHYLHSSYDESHFLMLVSHIQGNTYPCYEPLPYTREVKVENLRGKRGGCQRYQLSQKGTLLFEPLACAPLVS